MAAHSPCTILAELNERRCNILSKVSSALPNCEINELLEIMVEYHNKAEACQKQSDEREDTLTRLYEEVQAARGERVAAHLSKQRVEEQMATLQKQQRDLIEANIKPFEEQNEKLKDEKEVLIDDNDELRREIQRLKVGERASNARAQEAQRLLGTMLDSMNEDIRQLKFNSSNDRKAQKEATDAHNSLVNSLNAIIANLEQQVKDTMTSAGQAEDRHKQEVDRLKRQLEDAEKHRLEQKEMAARYRHDGELEKLRNKLEDAEMATEQAEMRYNQELEKARLAKVTSHKAATPYGSSSASASISTPGSSIPSTPDLQLNVERTSSERIYRPLEQLAELSAEEMDKLKLNEDMSGAMALAHRQAALEEEKFLERLNSREKENKRE